MLEQSIKEYVNRSVQVLLVDENGIVLEKKFDFLPIEIGSVLSDFHPFFFSLTSLDKTLDSEIKYNCIHLDQQANNIVADITFVVKHFGTLIIIEDLTQHYNYHQSVAQARNESIINAELLVLKNIELEERERFKNQFIQNFSHELRNPLTSIISITSLLSATTLNKEQENMLDFLKEANTNLKLMLEDILSISMIASGRLTMHEKVFNLHELLALLNYTYSAKGKLAELKFNLINNKEVPEWLIGDRLRLFQVLTNLLDNAIKYTKIGSIQLEVRLNQKIANLASLQFTVTDTGVGVAEAEHTNIFKSFTQANNENEKGEGVGLGLAVVKGLLNLMDSEPHIDSKIGVGSTFFFNIKFKMPLPSVIDNLRKKKKKVAKKIMNSNSGNKYRILLVEDDVQVQMALFKVLLESGSFFIDLLNDGLKVIPEITETQYDLIIMDVNLPNVNGDKITALIRDFPIGDLKNTPILGITAYSADNNIQNYLDSGMNAVLAKPFDPEELLNVIFGLLK